MKKVQFGCGHHMLEGWDNRDSETDIRKRLPFEDNSVDYVFAEHVIEHVTTIEGLNFLKECHRILRHGGVIRIAFPDIVRAFDMKLSDEHIVNITHKWGHKSLWTFDTAYVLLRLAGFQSYVSWYGNSEHTELRGIEGHHLTVGIDLATKETTILEGTKL